MTSNLLGVMAYEMLAGQPPFTGASLTAVVHKVMLEEPRPIAEHRRSVPRHVDAAIAKALEKLPADRWQTATEFAEALSSSSAPAVRPQRSRRHASCCHGSLQQRSRSRWDGWRF